jgi:hypothetical protein
MARNSALSFLDRRHPGWALEAHWRLCIQTFEGGPEWMAANLFRFHKEGKREFAERLKRAYRDNLSRDVCETFTAHLFKAGVSRDEENAPPFLLDFIKRATRGHNSQPLTDFMRGVSDKTNAVSPCYLLVDMPSADGAPATLADEQAMGLEPYVYALWPTDVLNYGITPDGDFTWALIREDFVDDSDPRADEPASEERYRLWTREDWQLYRKLDKAPGFELIETQAHPLGVVPLVRVVHKEHDSVYRGIGLIDEIVYKDRAIANNESRLDCIIADQTFSTLWMPDAGLIANTERDAEGKRQRMIAAATNRISMFHDKAQHVPFYLAPDAAQAGIIVDLIERLRAQIWEDALLGSENREKSGGPKTATEAEFDFEKLNGALADNAANMEAAERRVLKLVALWKRATVPGEMIAQLSRYPRKFNVQALIDSLSELLGFQKFPQFGETFWTKALSRIATRYLPDLTDDEKQAMADEIGEHFQMSQLIQSAPLFAQGIPTPALPAE